MSAGPDSGDTAWLLTSAALVLLMLPGLAFFYGGMVRAKSVLNMMMMVFGALAVVMVVWVLVGYSLAFGDDLGGGLLGDPFQFAGLKGMIEGDPGSSYPGIVFAAFQGLFAAVTVGLIAGAIADRTRFGTWLVFAALWTVLVYAPVCHWIFKVADDSGRGGWMVDGLGALDFAGGTAVEINSGAAGLAAAIVLGRRVGFGRDPMKPHNLTLTMIGAGLLWFGWFGFNAGSALAANQTAGVVFVNTLMAGCTGLLAWLLVERLRDGQATSFGAASGVVAGLVAITPSCGAVTPIGSMLVGLAAGAVCAFAVGWKFRFGYDDSLDVVGVHLIGGLVGTLIIGLLASRDMVDHAGLFYGGGADQLVRQSVAALATFAFSGVMTVVLALVLQRTMGFRVSAEHEIAGVDLELHSESAYDLHASTGGARPHLSGGSGTLLH